jgi:hypothetical protein
VNQFIVYRRSDKAPVDYRTGKPANAHDSSNWTDVATASSVAQAWGAEWGIGFVLTEQSQIAVIDVDGCRNPQTGEISLIAQTLITMLAGAYVEISIGGKGIHIWFRYSGAMPPHASRAAGIGEFYHKDRYIAIGAPYAAPSFTNGSLGTDHTVSLPSLIATFFPPDASSVGESEWTTEPREDWNGPLEDSELLRRAMQSRSTASAFGGKASFADLWLANESVLAVSYPDANGRAYDASAADAALAQHLSFWTGGDCARIERLMRGSKLVREKWERNADVYSGPGMGYIPRTILGACGRQLEVLSDAASAPVPPPPGTVSHAPTPRGGDGFLDSEKQQAHFGQCVYVSGQNRALVPDGSLMKPDAFRVRYGGFNFNLDTQNMKTTRDAWEAWTQNQVYKCTEVDGICFKPNLPARSIVHANGQTFINTFIPVDIRRVVGDASPFLNHLAKVLPDERDRTILLSYMAACVQHQGIKFQWAPLLQGVEGNGKTLFARCVEQAVGTRYTYWPKAAKISATFNAWMANKVFYAVEDIYVPDSKREILEDLKPMITGDKIEIEAKGIDQFISDICGNFMFNSNHLDAIRKTENDRRFCVLFSAQQQSSDLRRDGLTESYFVALYNWLREEGYAIVNELLFTYAIPAELNPAGDCQRAPVTTSTSKAIKDGLGSLEQEIAEAVAQGLPGFSGDWISTTWLERLLERMRLNKISHSKRKQILEQMGYIYHPALTDGRPNNPVLPDNTKPRLFVLAGSLTSQIPTAAAATKHYEAANANKSPVGLPFAAHQFGRSN